MIRWLSRAVVFLLVLVAVIILAVEFAPPRWVGSQAQALINERTDADVFIEAIDLHVIGLNPSIQVTNASVSDSDSPEAQAQMQIASFGGSIRLLKLLTGVLYINEIAANDGSVSVAIDANGEGNWQYFLPQTPSDDTPSEGNDEPTSLNLPTIERLAFNDLKVDFTDEQRALDAQLQLNLNGSGLDTTPTTFNANGTLNELATTLDISTNLLSSILESGAPVAIDLGLTTGRTSVDVEGSVADIATIEGPESLEGTEFSFSTMAPDLGDVEMLTGLELPVIPPVAVSGALLVDGSELVVQGLDGTLGDSDIQGDIRVDPSTTPPTVFANLISRRLDLDDLVGFIGGEPDPIETAIEASDTQEEEQSSEPQTVLPSDPIPITALASFFNGAIEYRADAIESPVWPLQSMNTRIEIQGPDVSINPLNIGVADGDVSGVLLMDTAATPAKSEVALDVKDVNIKKLLQAINLEDESFGIVGGQIRYWVEGDSIADMAASADGGMFLLMTQGQLNSLLAEVAGVDLLESLMVLIDPEQSRTAINCAYLDLQSADGVSNIETLVFDTNDVVLLADGSIDLNDESLDITIEPHPKDVSVLAAQTAARISGTFSDLSVLPSQTLYARAAAAAILATIATPAAAFIPFIEAGTGTDSAYCDGMITALDDARE